MNKRTDINPAMIVLARESRGMTQADLAEAVGIPQGTLSKIEGGVSQIDPDDVKKLVSVLRYREGFFTDWRHHPAGPLFVCTIDH